MAMKIRLARGRVQEAALLPDRCGGLAHAAGRPLHREAGHLQSPASQGQRGRVKMNPERIKHWLGQGAMPTDRVSRMLEAAELVPARERNTIKGKPRKKAQERAEAAQEG